MLLAIQIMNILTLLISGFAIGVSVATLRLTNKNVRDTLVK